jgi:hypothetical protein
VVRVLALGAVLERVALMAQDMAVLEARWPGMEAVHPEVAHLEVVSLAQDTVAAVLEARLSDMLLGVPKALLALGMVQACLLTYPIHTHRVLDIEA